MVAWLIDVRRALNKHSFMWGPNNHWLMWGTNQTLYHVRRALNKTSFMWGTKQTLIHVRRALTKHIRRALTDTRVDLGKCCRTWLPLPAASAPIHWCTAMLLWVSPTDRNDPCGPSQLIQWFPHVALCITYKYTWILHVYTRTCIYLYIYIYINIYIHTHT